MNFLGRVCKGGCRGQLFWGFLSIVARQHQDVCFFFFPFFTISPQNEFRLLGRQAIINLGKKGEEEKSSFCSCRHFRGKRVIKLRLMLSVGIWKEKKKLWSRGHEKKTLSPPFPPFYLRRSQQVIERWELLLLKTLRSWSQRSRSTLFCTRPSSFFIFSLYLPP